MRSIGTPRSPRAWRSRTNSVRRLFNPGSMTSKSKSLSERPSPRAREPNKITLASGAAAAKRLAASAIRASSVIGAHKRSVAAARASPSWSLSRRPAPRAKKCGDWAAGQAYGRHPNFGVGRVEGSALVDQHRRRIVQQPRRVSLAMLLCAGSSSAWEIERRRLAAEAARGMLGRDPSRSFSDELIAQRRAATRAEELDAVARHHGAKLKGDRSGLPLRGRLHPLTRDLKRHRSKLTLRPLGKLFSLQEPTLGSAIPYRWKILL